MLSVLGLLLSCILGFLNAAYLVLQLATLIVKQADSFIESLCHLLKKFKR